MLLDIVLGALVGAVGLWGAFAGVFDQLTDTRGRRMRTLPRSFWLRSAVIATAGAVLGAVLMWMQFGGIRN